jgi:sugar phosphate isomerase/epimerase
MLKELGYAGLGYWERDPNKDAAGLQEMLVKLDENGLKLYGEYFTLNIDEPNETMKFIMDSFPYLRDRHTSIWLALTSSVHQKSNPTGDMRAAALITELAEAAHKQGIGIDLYPHVNFWLEKADDAIRVAGKVNRRNVGVVFNLYHHLKTRGLNSVEQTIKQTMPYLDGVTINGTSKAGSIETLDKGDFDVYGFLKILKKEGYKGPIGLQGYGITGNVQENLSRSMEAWKKFNERSAIEESLRD